MIISDRIHNQNQRNNSAEDVFICYDPDNDSDESSLVCAVFTISKVINDVDINYYSLVFGLDETGSQVDQFFKYYDFSANIAVSDSAGGGWFESYTYSVDTQSFTDTVPSPEWRPDDKDALDELISIKHDYLEINYDNEEAYHVIRDGANAKLYEYEPPTNGLNIISTEDYDDEVLINLSSFWKLRMKWVAIY